MRNRFLNQLMLKYKLQVKVVVNTNFCVIITIASVILLLTSSQTNLLEGQQATKTGKSYQLIVYLDGAHVGNGNAIGDNFKIAVYNSDNETILSAKPTIDFNDSHQKISPKNGYSINYELGQHPEQIKVCAQQEYSLNGKGYLHNDCYNIKQNNDKTYWYTIFDYGQIDGFEGSD